MSDTGGHGVDGRLSVLVSSTLLLDSQMSPLDWYLTPPVASDSLGQYNDPLESCKKVKILLLENRYQGQEVLRDSEWLVIVISLSYDYNELDKYIDIF